MQQHSIFKCANDFINSTFQSHLSRTLTAVISVRQVFVTLLGFKLFACCGSQNTQACRKDC